MDRVSRIYHDGMIPESELGADLFSIRATIFKSERGFQLSHDGDDSEIEQDFIVREVSHGNLSQPSLRNC